MVAACPFIARMDMIMKGLLITSFLTSSEGGGVTGSSLLEAIGKPIELSFPNPQLILGVGGLTYHREIDTWTATSETYVGSSLDDEFPGASTPRFYHMKLDFVENSLEFVSGPIAVSDSNVDNSTSSTNLKLEDVAAYPEPALSSASTPLQKDLWLASEGNSHLTTTNVFFSKDYGPPDLNTFDPETYSPSRLLRVDAASGEVLEEAKIPSFAQWDGHYDWESTSCIGDRPFQGMHSLSITPSTSDAYDYILFAGFQAALFQDGSSPTYFSGSATRVLTYGLTSPSGDNRRETTAIYINSFRYDTSHLTLKSYQKSTRHFNALFGMLAFNETSLLMIETEDLTGFSHRKIVNRIFYVELDSSATVDHCPTLLNCDIGAPTKYLVWERYDDHHLDGVSWGPELDDGRLTVVLTFEKDGLHLEQYVLNIDELKKIEPWGPTNDSSHILKNRIIASSTGIAIFIVLALTQFFFLRHRSSKFQSMDIETAISTKIEMEENDRSDEEKISSDMSSGLTGQIRSRIIARYAMASAMMNSFLVGGVTFGYSGMVLILRKEGIYSESCSCGSFCAGQKEQLALISTVGFAAAIGSRLFIGLFMDRQGPKTTSVLCCLICFVGFLLLAISDESQLSDIFLPAWVLLSLGGSGLHITGFHFTNLFQGDGKKRAAAGISAAFGASSAIFPLMQIFNQYLEINLSSMAIFYSCIVFLITINNLIVQPWNKITAGVPFQPDLNVIRKSWWKRDLKTKPFLTSIVREIKKFDFLGEAMFYSVSLLLITHYLSTSSQLMYENGDISFTTNPNEWNDYIIARMAGWFNALGFVWFPCVQYILTRYQWSHCYIILMGINIAIIGIILVKNLEIQILGFSLLAFGRLLLFSCHHAYILDVFGIEFFGTLNGLSSFLAAIVGFISYPLQLFALVANYSLSFVPIGLFILFSIAFPLVLKKRNVLNWAETVSVDPTQFRYPKSIDQVKELVRKNKKIRCAGAMHSCAPLIASDGIIMSLTKMDKIISIDPVNKRVRCQSGVRIHNLCEALAPHGLAVGTLGTIDWQTISGAVMTGTHGGALTIPSLHTFVTSYTIVKTDATVVTVTRESDPRLFSAIAPSMGMLGVVIEMELECTDFQMLEAKMVTISFDELTSDSVFEQFMNNNKYCRVVVYPSINKATVWTANPVASVETALARGAIDCSDQYINFRDENEKARLEQYLILCKNEEYVKADGLLHKVLGSQQSRLGHYVGQYNHVLCKERNNGIPHADIEFNFDFEKNGQVLKTVKQYCETKRVPYYNFEIRTTKQDDAMLSCCHSRDAMWIDFQAKAGISKDFFREIEELLKPIGFRKHWAKGLGNTNPKYVVNEFPMIGDFLKIVKEYDPDGKFRNIEGEIWYQEMSELVRERMECGDNNRRGSLRSMRDSIISSVSGGRLLRRESMRDSIISIVSGGDAVEDEHRRGSMSRRDSLRLTESIYAAKARECLAYELEKQGDGLGREENMHRTGSMSRRDSLRLTESIRAAAGREPLVNEIEELGKEDDEYEKLKEKH